jgi:gliding motility-associated-like protein
MVRFCFLLLLVLLASNRDLFATHNRAGEITIRQLGDLTIEVTVTTYTKTTSTPADRDSLRVYWGDGSFEYVYRTNGDGEPLANNRKLNYYVAVHTYPGRATYTISMMDPNRNGGILNVNPPNSEGVPFYIEATYTFLNPQFQGYNNTAILLQRPIDFACVGERFIHNPSAHDPDGDSLSFEFIVPLQDSGMNVPNYIFPQQIEPGPDNQMFLDPEKGNLIWTYPKIAGEYNIAFRINEYRGGVLISSFIRDMQILVLPCENAPPEISAIEEICVVAGEKLELNINVSDPDTGQLVELTAVGGPFEVPGQKAMLEAGSGGFQAQPFTARLIWEPQCEHIRDQPYTVIIKAVDNEFDTTGLADLHAIRIRVIGPAPQGLEILNAPDAFHLSWDLPYACDATINDYFRGFSIWKRTGSNQFGADSCETGLEGRGYTRIAGNWKQTMNGRYFYEDGDIDDEGSYCYRILAEFALTTPSGQPYLRVVSIPSNEVCLRAKADRPLITRVTVDETSPTAGRITIKWIGPLPEAIDTAMHSGPYRFQLQRADGIDGTNFTPVPGAVFSSPTFAGLKDSTFQDTGLDTEGNPYTYRVDFMTGPVNTFHGPSQPASSIFLTTLPSDESSLLSWEYNSPWDNYLFEIWRSDLGAAFQLIATTTEEHYVDNNGIFNGVEYCYKIIASGDYGLETVQAPLINHSQESCVTPFDNVPPCPVNLAVSNICDEAGPGTPADAFINYISWNLTCPEDDLASYQILYSAEPGEPLAIIANIDAIENSYEHKPGEKIAGCYSIIAIDQNGNESEPSEIVCVKNCPVFELPNAFTPNGDGQNDLFTPFRSRFIEAIDFKVFNRWGQVVFQTKDPMINWNGSNESGKSLSDGVYYYTCQAYESEGISPIVLSGFIELIRG